MIKHGNRQVSREFAVNKKIRLRIFSVDLERFVTHTESSSIAVT
jgi:hypothetical protein